MIEPCDVRSDADDSWTLQSTTPWIQVAPTRGTGPASIAVSVLLNATGSDLTTSLVVQDASGTQPVSLTERFETQTVADNSAKGY